MKLKRRQILLLVMAAAILLFGTWVKHHLNQRRMISALSNGRTIFATLSFEKKVDGTSFHPFPSSAGETPFRTSTDYLRASVTSGFLVVDYPFFAASGVPPLHSRNPVDFTSDHNAWCVVADLTWSTPGGAPILFTKNLLLHSLNGEPRLTSSPPFGKRGVVVVFKNGGGKIFSETEIREYLANLRMTNRVLRP